MALGQLAVDVPDEIGDLLGKVLDAERARTVREGARGARIAARGTTDAEVQKCSEFIQ